ncbi:MULTISPECIES: ArsR/SmtB family transcription factor [Actinomadura]|uniref:ArsR/SmtB family transcription factor n=1 Tax=Actinomadura yumaensis TaxID=111807 RepID=A0ABW2CDY8_9ACTN|nr:metalloregulator ArsR/SmtB family transcription factor [Actinomadura sp. J1-007]MWK38137.1 metalloregulator ArsR/SmtB family transcription factor [Actinomadura sp. J1-007]
MRQIDRLSITFAALADPTRRAMLARLVQGEATVGELAEPFELSPPAVSKHLKVLRDAGLVEQGRHAQWRPCRLRPEPLREVAAWMETYREFLGQSFDRLDGYLRRLQDEQHEQGEQDRRAEQDERTEHGGHDGGKRT